MVPPSLHPLFPMDPECQCLGSVFLGGISLNTSGIPARLGLGKGILGSRGWGWAVRYEGDLGERSIF